MEENIAIQQGILLIVGQFIIDIISKGYADKIKNVLFINDMLSI